MSSIGRLAPPLPLETVSRQALVELAALGAEPFDWPKGDELAQLLAATVRAHLRRALAKSAKEDGRKRVGPQNKTVW